MAREQEPKVAATATLKDLIGRTPVDKLETMTQTIAIIVPPIAVSVDATAVSDEEGENDVMLVQLIDILIIGDFQVTTLEQQKVCKIIPATELLLSHRVQC